MAGSYYHIVDENTGDLLDNEDFVEMIENLGDAYEMAEEMYGMIWWLAHMAPDATLMPEDLVVMAHQNYKLGLAQAKANKRKKVF